MVYGNESRMAVFSIQENILNIPDKICTSNDDIQYILINYSLIINLQYKYDISTGTRATKFATH